MSPAKSPGQGDLDAAAATRREINGPRPPLLKIHKESHLIKKASHHYPSSSSSNNSSSSCSSSLSNPIHLPADSSQQQQQQQPRRPQPQGTRPVIIYTHSPKIIHTKARDFMALVQKLTGLSRSHHHDEGEREPAPTPDPPEPQKASTDNKIALNERDASSSVLSEDKRSGAGPEVREANCISPIPSHQNALISEIPLFTPNSADFFLSPGQRMYRYPYSAYTSPSTANRIISPSMSEFMKEMPEC